MSDNVQKVGNAFRRAAQKLFRAATERFCQCGL